MNSDFFDNIEGEVEINSSYEKELECVAPRHKFIIQAFVGDIFDKEKVKHIVCSSLNKLNFDLTYEIEISEVSAMMNFIETTTAKPTVQVNIDVIGYFSNIQDVVSFIDAICFGRYIRTISGNLPLPSVFIEYQSPIKNDIHVNNLSGHNNKWSVTTNNRYEVNLEISPDMYLHDNMSDFNLLGNHTLSAYTNSMLKICHYAIEENYASEEEMMNCLGTFSMDTLNDAQDYHKACLQVNDVIALGSDLNITESQRKSCCSLSDNLDMDRYFSLMNVFIHASNRIRNLDAVLDDDAIDIKGRSVIKTIGCTRILSKDIQNYVTVWDGYPRKHHTEDTQYDFFMRMFYDNREQLKRKFRFPTVAVPNITFYNAESEYIKITLRLGSLYDEKTKSAVIVTMGLCGNFDSVLELIKTLYKK